MQVLPRSRERSQRIRKIEEREFAKGQAEMYLDEGCAGRVPRLYADSHFSFHAFYERCRRYPDLQGSVLGIKESNVARYSAQYPALYPIRLFVRMDM